MPWTAADAVSHTKKANTSAKQAKWAKIANAARQTYAKRPDADAMAIRTANAKMMEALTRTVLYFDEGTGGQARLNREAKPWFFGSSQAKKSTQPAEPTTAQTKYTSAKHAYRLASRAHEGKPTPSAADLASKGASKRAQRDQQAMAQRETAKAEKTLQPPPALQRRRAWSVKRARGLTAPVDPKGQTVLLHPDVEAALRSKPSHAKSTVVLKTAK